MKSLGNIVICRYIQHVATFHRTDQVTNPPKEFHWDLQYVGDLSGPLWVKEIPGGVAIVSNVIVL